ncbi:Peptidase family M23 [Nitrosomonas cryotolerans]|uniref:Peptidase family M23 n=1 Tax=Nitrosomonas cryotolerans ATCC 49181 TaxID=1131553 RepID=A0A1N6JKY8_9PROT|nr:M23 family metallopeptidase [Nitrosomonas cryotolerans]SFP55798.1 Peptidase family M23 [Nitrosomonas cryotolerans]SIO45032.1 Peptidase family M23 [Nitrosomonas cryotolerans ATCC 49181]
MNIILISNKLARTKSLTLTGTHFLLIISVFFIIIVLSSLGLNYLSLRYADGIKSPLLRTLLVNPQEERHRKIQLHLHNNLNVMAIKLGQMQAQLLRLDALGERLTESSGIQSQESSINHVPGQGGGHAVLPTEEITFSEFNRKLQALSYALDERADRLGALDSLFRYGRLAERVLPSIMPVDTKWYSSGYGYRIDPFSGKRAFHKGVDFAVKAGTPIRASAGGVVVYSDRHPEYGNMIEIDHGDELISRYAHASKRLVKLGQVVLRGQIIAKVGSTGRSTGPHLHFEIRYKDVPQNPSRFLKMSG